MGVGSYLFRYAVGTADFRPTDPMGPVELVERAAALGAEVVQFAENLPLENVSPAVLDQTRALAERRGIVLEGGTAGADEAHLLKHLAITQRLNAHLFRLALHAPWIQPTYDDSVRVLRKVLPRFKEAGVAIAIENHFTMSSPELVSLIEEIDDPSVGICVDAANSIIQHEWPVDTVRQLAPYALSLHLKDYVLVNHPEKLGVIITGAPLGEGKQDIAGVLKLLREAGKDVNVILEQWLNPEPEPEQTLLKETAWIETGMRKLDSIKRRG